MKKNFLTLPGMKVICLFGCLMLAACATSDTSNTPGYVDNRKMTAELVSNALQNDPSLRSDFKLARDQLDVLSTGDPSAISAFQCQAAINSVIPSADQAKVDGILHLVLTVMYSGPVTLSLGISDALDTPSTLTKPTTTAPASSP